MSTTIFIICGIVVGIGILTILILIISGKLKFQRRKPKKEKPKPISNQISNDRQESVATKQVEPIEPKVVNTPIAPIDIEAEERNIGQQELDKYNSETIVVSTMVGQGLWTSICVGFANIFGVKSKNYIKKLDKLNREIMSKLSIETKRKGYDYFTDVKVSISGLSATATAKMYKK